MRPTNAAVGRALSQAGVAVLAVAGPPAAAIPLARSRGSIRAVPRFCLGRGRQEAPTMPQAHFTVFLSGVGYHESAWKLADPADLTPEAWFPVLEGAAQSAERGL